jgi:alpha-glucosidase
MSREGIYGLEQNKWGAIPAGHYAALPFTRLIAGHADVTPGYFGTRHNQLDGSSWAQQLACAIVYTTSALHIVSPPSDVHSAAPVGSPQLDLLKNLPTLWDETRVLPGADIGKFAPYARRKGNVWYVGVLNGAGVRNGILKLDFLAPGVKYKAIIIADDLTENATWQVSEAVLTRTNTLPFALRSSGGLVVRLTPTK